MYAIRSYYDDIAEYVPGQIKRRKVAWMRRTDEDIATIRDDGFERFGRLNSVWQQSEADFRTRLSELNQIAVTQRGFRLFQSVHEKKTMPCSIA